jgi:hypothetical protein
MEVPGEEPALPRDTPRRFPASEQELSRASENMIAAKVGKASCERISLWNSAGKSLKAENESRRISD